MRSYFGRCVAVLAVAVASLTVASSANAGPLNGSLPLVGFGTTQDGANLAVSNLFTSTDTVTSGTGTGDYSPIGSGESFGPHTLDLSLIATGGTFAITHASFGSFVATSGSIISQSASFLNVFLLGDFTPGPGLPGFDPTPSSAHLTINQTGDSISEALTLASPPENLSVPEPASVTLLGMGAVSLIGYGWRRRRGANA